MANYTFESLSPRDFEQLVAELLSTEEEVTFELFTPGRDGGIDARYLGEQLDSPLIVQAKHYPRASFPVLKSKIREEVPKVRKLKPRDYRIATSVGLSPANKNALVEMFSPFILSPANVYGRDDLNLLLAKHPDVEKANFKLWLTSTAILEKLFNNDIFVRTQGLEQRIEKKLRLYVKNRSFFEARAKLDELNVCIIAGVPGIGKTMLAEMLLVSCLDKGYEAIAVSDDINEALELYGEESRQVFYYDDFLGQTSSLEKLRKNEDARLLDFIEQVQAARNKKLILTTREYILAQARMRYERLDRADVEIMKCVIALDDYTRLERAQILYNHLYFSDLPYDSRVALLMDERYLTVVDHENYSPRIIETVVNLARDAKVDAGAFPDVFVKSLDDPKTIWRHAFEHQIGDLAQTLMLLLAGMPRDVDLERLGHAFRAHAEARVGQKPSPAQFRDVLRALDDSFIRIDRSGDGRVVEFANPSVRDFMLSHLDESGDEFRLLWQTAQYFDQVVLLGAYGGATRAFDPAESFSGMELILSAEPELLLEALRRTFRAPECGIVAHHYGRTRIIREPRRVGPEERSRLVLEACRRMGTAVPAWFVDELNNVVNGWVASSGDKEEAVALLAELTEAKGVAQHAETEATKWFTGTLDTAEDYRRLAELSDERPDLIPSSALTNAQDELTAMLSSEIDEVIGEASDYDRLVGSVDNLLDIAITYGIDSSAVLDEEEYEQRLAELAEPDEDYDRDRYESGGYGGAADANDAELHSLFDSLRE